MIAAQNTLAPAQIPTAMSTLVFSQNLGGALMTVIAQTIFTNSLSRTLHEYAPKLDASAIIKAGSTAMRSLVSANDLPHLLKAYSESSSRTFYLTTAIAMAGFFVSYWMGWKDIRVKSAKAI